jgi:hypothetical protein
MICVKTQRIIQGDRDEEILQWSVFFQTPVGLAITLAGALETCKRLEIDPVWSISPVSVAQSKSMNEVWAR